MKSVNGNARLYLGGRFYMIVVCKKHVNKGLKMIFLPHIQPISDEYKESANFNCKICAQQADFKLFNFLPQREHLVKQSM
jgi:predicted nucleotide-binding protein (sugar kinase/HSP70/actin superfamily)